MDILNQIKLLKTDVINKQQIINELELNLLGNVDLIHTPNGFIRFCKGMFQHLIYVVDSNIIAPTLTCETKLVDIYENGKPHPFIIYKDWYLDFKIAPENIIVTRYKDKKYTFGYLEAKDPEILINIRNEKVCAFKDGTYIDFLKNEIFDVLIKRETEQKLQRALKLIEEQQENFKTLDDF